MIGYLFYIVFYFYLKKSLFFFILFILVCVDKFLYCFIYKDYCNDFGYKDYLEKGCCVICNFCGKVFILVVLFYFFCL